MDIASIPATVYVACGVITAALLTGLFSFMNMVSSKENKVSEFRLVWVDGLRNEIAEYISAAQELGRVAGKFDSIARIHSEKEEHALDIEWYKETRDVFSRAVESLSKIQLRLNADHIAEDSDTPEARLMKAILTARELSIKGDFNRVIHSCDEIRSAAAPILKSTWDLVKRGEIGYRRIRRIGLFTVTLGFYAVVTFGLYIGFNTYKAKVENDKNQTTQKIQTLYEALEKLKPHPANKSLQEILDQKTQQTNQ